MEPETTIKAWRDPLFRASLPPSLLHDLKEHPAGSIGDDPSDWSVQLGALPAGNPEITAGGGCGTSGCSAIVCTDPCLTFGCPRPPPATESLRCTRSLGTCLIGT